MTNWLLVVTLTTPDGPQEWRGGLAGHFPLAEAARWAVDRALAAWPAGMAIERLTVTRATEPE